MNSSTGSVWLTLTNVGILQAGWGNPDLVSTNLTHALVSATPQTLTCDPDGNLTNDGRFSYSWDQENRLVGMVSLTNTPAESKRSMTMAYDWSGRRIRLGVALWTNSAWRVVVSNKFLYDGWTLAAELNATNNAVLRTYTWGLDLSGTMCSSRTIPVPASRLKRASCHLPARRSKPVCGSAGEVDGFRDSALLIVSLCLTASETRPSIGAVQMKSVRAIFLAGALCGFGGALRAELANGIQAIVHDAIITYQEVENNTVAVAEELRRQYRTQPEVYNQRLTEALNDTLERLLERQLILHEFATAGYSLPESVIEDYVQERIRGRYRDHVTFIKSLQEEGLTYEKFRQQMRDQFIVDQMRYKNVSGEILISPHKIESHYLAHTNDFKMDEEVKLRMIVLNKPSAGDAGPVRKLAEEIIGKIKEGAAFAEMAAVYSEGRQGREGGDWGWVQKLDRDGALVLRKELADVAFALKPGELSGVIETPEVIYLMLVEDKRPAYVKALNEVRGEIERTLISQEQERLRKQWIERLKQKTFIRYF